MLVMCRCQSLRYLDGNSNRFFDAQMTFLEHIAFQRDSLDEFHDDIMKTALIHNVINAHNIWKMCIRDRDAAVIERLIRGLNPWPSAYTKFEGKTLKIWSADVEEDAAGRPSPETFGQVVRVGKDAFSVQTGKGLLTIRELQLEGKKRMDKMCIRDRS